MPKGLGYRTLSGMLMPAEWAYRFGVWARSSAFERGWLKSETGAIRTLAIGNLTVGGTGKTPMAAWFARAFAEEGQRPAIVLRGYGGDEAQVHQWLNPSIPVYAAPDRRAGVRRAGVEGADIAVLDDAFQHRAIVPDAQVVLVAAEEWTEAPRLLPRGPWREPLAALGRATLVVITRKTASEAESDRLATRLLELHPTLPQACAHIRLAGLSRFDASAGELGPRVEARGFNCELVLAGVARPDDVFAQLADAGVSTKARLTFPDHYRYSAAEIDVCVERAGRGPIVATLKDAVKLGPALRGRVELYVPLQEISWESGLDNVTCLRAKLRRAPPARRAPRAPRAPRASHPAAARSQ